MTTTEGFFVSRTLLALEVLTFEPSSAPEVADALQVHPRTARRLLNRLVADGWATRAPAPARTYAPTMRLVALAAQLAERAPLANTARPVITRLHRDTGALAHLCIPSYRSVLCLVHRGGGPDLRPQLRELIPAHATAAGKILLAFREPWRESFLERELPALTPRTITDRDRLRGELDDVRDRGYAIEDGELEDGLQAIAAPVVVDGIVAASIGVSFSAPGLESAPVDALLSAAKKLEGTA